MLFLNKTRQNLLILTVVFSFLAVNIAATAVSSQVKSGTKPTPTPVKKKVSSTPGKTVKAAVKTTPKPAPTNSKTPPKTTGTPLPRESTQVIVSVAAARVRSQASTSSSELRRVKLGTLVKFSEKKGDWYKVQIPASPKPVTGWMSNQVVNDYDVAKREDIYARIIERNYKPEGMSFGDASELYEFLTRAQADIKTQKLAMDAGFKRLITLRSALKSITIDKQNQKNFKDFLKLHDKEIVYSDPSGEWYVRSSLFWDLHKKYSSAANAEEIAWAASTNPLPGECEGYVNCYLFMLSETNGEYLNLYPNGKFAPEALKNIKDFLEPVVADLAEKKIYTGPTDISDRAEFNRILSELRTIVSKISFSESEKLKTIQQFNQIAEGYR